MISLYTCDIYYKYSVTKDIAHLLLNSKLCSVLAMLVQRIILQIQAVQHILEGLYRCVILLNVTKIYILYKDFLAVIHFDCWKLRNITHNILT